MRLSDTNEAIRMAMDTLRTNKLRSGLTMLGIMIGVTTVILISSVINGLTNNVNALISTLGTNVYWVFRFPVFGSRPTAEMLARKQLTYEDGEAMKVLPHVVAVDASQQYRGPQGAEHHAARGIGRRTKRLRPRYYARALLYPARVATRGQCGGPRLRYRGG